jgi:hypothetical protein
VICHLVLERISASLDLSALTLNTDHRCVGEM